MQADEGDGQAAHTRAIACVVFAFRHFGLSGAAVLHNATAHGVADVFGFAAHPVAEGFGDAGGFDFACAEDGVAQGKAHFGVVGNLARFEFQPAAADHVFVHAVFVADFSRGHEFDGCAQCITDGKAEVGGYSPKHAA